MRAVRLERAWRGLRSQPWRQRAARLRVLACRVPGVQLLARAVANYIGHQSANQAGSIAFSVLLSMFPLLLMVSAAAGFIGRPGDAVEMAMRVLDYAPPVVQHALRPAIAQVLGQRNQALLAIGLLVTVWTASSGVLAVRTALNKAYGVQRGLSFWKARLKVTLFTVVVGVAITAAFGLVVVMPYVWQLVAQAGAELDEPWLRYSVRYGTAFVVVTAMYALLYGWLPDIPQRLRSVLPGAVVGALLWIGLAALLSYTLRSAGKLMLVYGGFAGLVATLVYLYANAVTLIFGAEINALLRDED